MIRYLFKTIKNERKLMLILLLPIVFSTFLIYFSYIINLNLDAISTKKNDIAFNGYNVALWCDNVLTEEDYFEIRHYLEPYDYVERKLIYTDYGKTQVAVIGIDYDEEIPKGFFKCKNLDAIANSSFLNKLDSDKAENPYINYKEDTIYIDTSVSGSHYETIREMGYSVVVPQDRIDFSEAGIFYIVNVEDDELLRFQNEIKDNFSMVGIKTITESLEDYSSEYSDIVTGIMLLMCLAIVVCSIIVYNSFSMTMLKEQQNIGQLQSFGIRNTRCYSIYLCKLYVIAILALIWGIFSGISGLFLIKEMKLFNDFHFFELQYFDAMGVMLCVVLEVIILTIVYIVVIRKTRKNSIVENLRGKQENLNLKKYRLPVFIISILLLCAIRMIGEKFFLWFNQRQIIMRMLISVLYMGISVFLIVFILSRCLSYLNKILLKVFTVFDFKSISFAIKNFIASERNISVVFIIYTIAIIVSTGVYCNFACFANSIRNEIDETYNYQLQLMTTDALNDNEIDKMSSIKGIRFIDAVSLVEIKINDYDVVIENIYDTETFMSANNVDVSLLNDGNHQTDIILTSNLAKRFGWAKNSKQEVVVDNKKYELHIVGIVPSGDYLDERIYSYNSLLATEYPYKQFVYRIGLGNSQDSEEVLEKIFEKGLSFSATMNIADYKDELVYEIVGNITILNIICIAIVTIAFASVINILSSYVKQQQNIYASIIAIGTSKGFILKTIVIDILMVFIYSSIISLFMAPAFSRILIACMSTVTKRDMDYQFSFGYCLALCLVTIVIGLNFAVYYGIKNSRMDVVEKIKLKAN